MCYEWAFILGLVTGSIDGPWTGCLDMSPNAEIVQSCSTPFQAIISRTEGCGTAVTFDHEKVETDLAKCTSDVDGTVRCAGLVGLEMEGLISLVSNAECLPLSEVEVKFLLRHRAARPYSSIFASD